MRKTFLAVALAASIPVMGATMVGCNSAWWQNFINDPVANVQGFEQGVQIALNDAQVAWTFVLPFLPAANAAAINQQFQNAIFAVNHALTVLTDAVNAAVAAQTPNPNFMALMAAVTDAVAQVLAVIEQYTNPAPAVVDGAAPAPVPAAAGVAAKAPYNPALYDAQMILAHLQKQYGTKAPVVAPTH